MEQMSLLSDLAVKLRVLRPQEKNKYLYELSEYAEDYHLHEKLRHPQDMFLPHRIAGSMYYSLEGKPFTQPEFLSRATMRDVAARGRFDAIFAGVIAYRDASDDQRAAFKKSMLRRSNPFSKISYLIKTYQRELR